MQNAPMEHSAILSTCTKRSPVFKTFVLSMFEWPLKTGFTVYVLRSHQKYCISFSKDRFCISKQCRPSLNAAYCSSASRSKLFAKCPFKGFQSTKGQQTSNTRHTFTLVGVKNSVNVP